MSDALPAGYHVWTGRVTPAQQQWAHKIEVATRSWPDSGYGQIFHNVIDGQHVAARVEKHTWTTNAKGEQIPCSPICHGVTLYMPPPDAPLRDLDRSGRDVPSSAPPPPATTDATARTMSAIIFASVVFGTAFAAANAYFRAKRLRGLSREAYVRMLSGA